MVRLLNVVTTHIKSTSVAVVFRQFNDFFTDCIRKLQKEEEINGITFT